MPQPSQPPPYSAAVAPGALPLLGHGHRLLRGSAGYLSSLHLHGDLVAVRLGPMTVQVPCHPDLLNQMLADHRLFDKGGAFYDRARDVAGNGLVTARTATTRTSAGWSSPPSAARSWPGIRASCRPRSSSPRAGGNRAR
ncbi:hypothetical protein [Kitasatospora sp. NPDC059673]|uniref:hypothetical protein n=1 Tax=Kitasatospora sp. NPDC059673 TaxID=3346901 RepID=UPI0036BF2B26